MFSILIPTYNNLAYLKLCIESIEKNSKYKHQILIHVNEGVDGTLDFVKNSVYNFTFSEENIGMPKALNKISNTYSKFPANLINFCSKPSKVENLAKKIYEIATGNQSLQQNS